MTQWAARGYIVGDPTSVGGGKWRVGMDVSY